VLGGRDAPDVHVQQRVGAVARDAARVEVGLGELLAEHRLHGVATDDLDVLAVRPPASG